MRIIAHVDICPVVKRMAVKPLVAYRRHERQRRFLRSLPRCSVEGGRQLITKNAKPLEDRKNVQAVRKHDAHVILALAGAAEDFQGKCDMRTLHLSPPGLVERPNANEALALVLPSGNLCALRVVQRAVAMRMAVVHTHFLQLPVTGCVGALQDIAEFFTDQVRSKLPVGRHGIRAEKRGCRTSTSTLLINEDGDARRHLFPRAWRTRTPS